MKILVTIKSVEDPEIKIKIKPDGTAIETDQMKYVVNPFDEIAVEEAVRIVISAGLVAPDPRRLFRAPAGSTPGPL